MIIWNRLLVGVDADPKSLDAVHYLAAVLGGSDACRVKLVSVYVPPQRDRYPRESLFQEAVAEMKRVLLERLEEARRILVEARMPESNVETAMVEAGSRTIGETLIETQRQEGHGTLVVGRRGMSKAEEFLFGSVSNTVVHQANNCCVWVVA